MQPAIWQEQGGHISVGDDHVFRNDLQQKANRKEESSLGKEKVQF
jgi:hypothetical protein